MAIIFAITGAFASILTMHWYGRRTEEVRPPLGAAIVALEKKSGGKRQAVRI
jgi:hypothetical protein